MKFCFRKSVRPLVFKFILNTVIVFIILKLFTIADWEIILGFSFFIVGSYSFFVYLRNYHRQFICVSDGYIEQVYEGYEVRIYWNKAAGIKTDEAYIPSKGGMLRIRYAMVFDTEGRRIAFSDLSMVRAPSVVIIPDGGAVVSDIESPELLLAICARKTDNEQMLEKLFRTPLSEGEIEQLKREPFDSRPKPEIKLEEVSETEGERHRAKNSGGGSSRSVSIGGVLALAGKIGGKLIKGVSAAFKTVKPGFALTSGAVYGALFSWKFALALMIMLFFHEYGHVHAMKKAV